MAIDREQINSTLDKWSDPEYDEPFFYKQDWRQPVKEMMVLNNVEGMRREAKKYCQGQIIELALSSQSEAMRFEASKFVLGQEGDGVKQKLEASIIHEAMPESQLINIILSKAKNLGKLNPSFGEALQLEAADYDIEELEDE